MSVSPYQQPADLPPTAGAGDGRAEKTSPRRSASQQAKPPLWAELEEAQRP